MAGTRSCDSFGLGTYGRGLWHESTLNHGEIGQITLSLKIAALASWQIGGSIPGARAIVPVSGTGVYRDLTPILQTFFTRESSLADFWGPI